MLNDNELQLFYTIKDYKYVCLIPKCKEEFEDFNEYKEHIDRNHLGYMTRRLRYFPYRASVDTSDVVINPAEKEMLDSRIKSDNQYYNLKINRDAGFILDAEIEHIVRNNKILCIECLGLPGTGKSYAMLSLGWTICSTWFELRPELFEDYLPQVHIGFNVNDTWQLMKRAKKGDVIIQDEDPALTGEGSGLSQDRLENLLKIMRKKGVSFIFVSPVETNFKVINFRFSTREYYTDTRITKLSFYSRKNDAFGYVYVRVLDKDDSRLIEYEKKKDENLEWINEHGGLVGSNYSDEELFDIINELYDICLDTDPTMSKKRIESIVSLKFNTNTRMNSYAVEAVYKMLKDYRDDNDVSDKIQKDKSVGYMAGNLEITNHFVESNVNILSLVHKYSSDYVDKGTDTSKKRKYSKKTLKRGMEYFNKRYVETIATEQEAAFEVNQIIKPEVKKGQMRNSLSAYKQVILGYAGEDAFAEAYAYKFEGIEKQGGNGLPDFIKKDENGDIEYIVEVKIRDADKRMTPEKWVNSDKEMLYAPKYLKEGVLLKLVVIYYNFGFCEVNMWDIRYKEEEADAED